MIQLVRQAMKSDTDAFLELMEQNSGAMYKVARAREQIREAYTDYPGQVKRQTENLYVREEF